MSDYIVLPNKAHARIVIFIGIFGNPTYVVFIGCSAPKDSACQTGFSGFFVKRGTKKVLNIAIASRPDLSVQGKGSVLI